MAKKKRALASPFVPVEEQPYKIPDNWCWIKLENISEIIMGQSPVGSDTTDDSSYMPLIGGAADMGIMYPLATRYTKVPTKISESGDLILCIRATLGKPIFSDGEYCLGRGVAAVRPFTGSKEFYRYFFLNFEQYLYDNATGTTFAQVSSKILKNMPVPFPPLSEQQRIVDRIESLFAKLDEAKEKAQAVVDGFELRKSAILHKAFSGELTERWRKEHGVELKGWQETNIDSISDVKGGKRVPKGMSLTTDDTGHPYLKAGNLKLGTVLDEGIMFVPDDVWQYIKNYTVNAGDVYITNVGACIGDCGIIPDKYDGANLTENAVKMTNLKCNSQFLAWYLSSNGVQQRIKNLIASATLGKLSITNIKTIPISLPTSEEQREIVFILDKLFRKEQQAQSAAEAVLSQIDIMKKAILARAFYGGLGTNDPAEEWAGALVKAVL